MVSISVSVLRGLREMGSEMLSTLGTGRRRLRMDDAAVEADIGSVTTRCLGGVDLGKFGGDGGGEC